MPENKSLQPLSDPNQDPTLEGKDVRPSEEDSKWTPVTAPEVCEGSHGDLSGQKPKVQNTPCRKGEHPRPPAPHSGSGGLQEASGSTFP